METNNETVERVCEKMRLFKDCDGDYVREIEDFADEIEDAHKRELAEKDAEIAKLKACRDGECERIRLGAEPCKGCHWQMSADAYDKLRSLVKELADALNDATAMACKGEYCNKHSFCTDCQATKNRALVAKAREVCK